MNRFLRDLPSEHWEKLERAVQEFEAAWQGGERPTIEHYLVANSVTWLPTLIELIHVDLEYRLAAGEAVRVEAYLERYPELARQRGAVIDLMTSEYQLRRQREPELTSESYRARFPEY